MSELTTCNFCIIKDMRNDAKGKKQRIILAPKDKYGMIPVMRVPKGIKKSVALKAVEKYSGLWVLEISSSCCC